MDKKLTQLLDKLGKTRSPSEAIPITTEALSIVSCDDDPRVWASLHGAQGAALVNAACGQFTDELFTQVLHAYESALTVYSPEETPEIWAQTMLNVGATHMGALQSGIGDAQEHVEAAIAAFQKTLEIPLERIEPKTWPYHQKRLAETYEIAALWRSPTALVKSARIYDTVLDAMGRDIDSTSWATLKLQFATCLYHTGDKEFTEEAIQAGEDALQAMCAERVPLEWAQANLILGGLYRSRSSGIREENLECAIASLNQALAVFTQEITPREWYEAHFHRGPAYFFRMRGDRIKNLEQASESLRIAIDGTSREVAPEEWGGLVVTMAQIYLEQSTGDRDKNIERAITTLESVLDILPTDSRSQQWTLANRCLGAAYLGREFGNSDENIEKAIQVLEEVQSAHPIPDNSAAWSATFVNLAQAYTRRVKENPLANRDRAIACLEAALTLSSDKWHDSPSWYSAQANLAILFMDENAEMIGKRPESGRGTVRCDKVEPVNRLTDPFNRKGHAEEIVKALRLGKEPLEADQDWHTPFLLNEQVGLLKHHLDQFLQSGAVVTRTPEERLVLEGNRLQLFRQIFDHLREKYSASLCTQEVLNAVRQGHQGFVLFLRGFNHRAEHYEAMSVSHVGGKNMDELPNRKQLVKDVAPVPVVWISNPVDSGPLELSIANAIFNDALESEVETDPSWDMNILGFRIEAGSSWEEDVRALVAAASFIVVHNPTMTPGIIKELGIIEELGRLEDTCFYHPEQAQNVLKNGIAYALDDAWLERLRTAVPRPEARTVTLPAPTCHWVEGARRTRVAARVVALNRWRERFVGSQAAVSTDLQLDIYFYLLGHYILLEELDTIPPLLESLSQTLSGIDNKKLKGATDLASIYFQFKTELQTALEKTPPNLVGLVRATEALKFVKIG